MHGKHFCFTKSAETFVDWQGWGWAENFSVSPCKKKKIKTKKTLLIKWVNQKFCKILPTRGTIWQLWMLLKKLWRWRIELDHEMLSSPDTLQLLLAGLPLWLGMQPKYPQFLAYLTLPNQWNFFNHLVTVLWTSVLSSCTQIFLVTLVALWPSSNS